MERLQKQAPTKSLTAAQKAEIADLESLYKSRIAQLEISIGDEIQAAQASEAYDKVDELKSRLVQQRARLEEDREDKKDRVRRG